MSMLNWKLREKKYVIDFPTNLLLLKHLERGDK
jgi:hypothetical protein